SIIPVDCLDLLSRDNRWDTKSFKDKLPPMIHENPMFNRVGRYPTSVQTFPDPILFLAGLKPSWDQGQQRPTIIIDGNEMAFRNFLYAENDKDLSFLPKEPSLNFGTGSPSVYINTEPPATKADPTKQLVENMTDSRDSPAYQQKLVIHFRSVAARIKDRKCKTRGSSKPHVKRRLVQAGSSSRATRKETSPKADYPFLTILMMMKGVTS
ncbi:hypothetical protein Tco_1321727, partial [Tanacetum coccineum]